MVARQLYTDATASSVWLSRGLSGLGSDCLLRWAKGGALVDGMFCSLGCMSPHVQGSAAPTIHTGVTGVEPAYSCMQPVQSDPLSVGELRSALGGGGGLVFGTPTHFFLTSFFATFTLWGGGTVRLTDRPLG